MPYLHEEKARKEGEEKGRQIGKKEGLIEVAKALKQKEISLTIIAETSGLSIEEIEKL